MKKTWALLILIIVFASFLRIWRLDKVPPGLFGDEVDVGYQAYCLLKTQSDIKGNFLPVYLDSLAEPRAPLLMYITALFLPIFGVNEWGVRMVPVLFGILSIYLIFLLTDELLKNKKAALISAVLLAIIPWHITYSRAAFEVSLLIFLILAGTLFFLKACKEKSINWVFSAIFFGLSFYTYNTANIFIPLWIIILSLLNRKIISGKLKKTPIKLIVPLFVGLIIIFPLLIQIFKGSAAFRFKLVSIFSDPKIIDTIVYKRSFAEPNNLVERFFHNKVIYWAKGISSNYLEAFSFKFLFVSGDPNPRQTVPGFGLIYYSMFIPFLVGIYYSLKNKNYLLLSWLAIAPLSSSLTTGGGNHATRLILMLPPIIILTSFGASILLKTKHTKHFFIFLTMIIAFELSLFLHEYFVHYPKEQFRYWHYGYKEILQVYEINKNSCQKLYLNNTHEPFFIRYLFWTKTDPKWFRQNFKGDKENEIVKEVFLSFRLGNSYFGRIIIPDRFSAIKKLLSERDSCYIAFQGDEVPGDWDLQKNPEKDLKVLGSVKDPNGGQFMYLLASPNE